MFPFDNKDAAYYGLSDKCLDKPVIKKSRSDLHSFNGFFISTSSKINSFSRPSLSLLSNLGNFGLLGGFL